MKYHLIKSTMVASAFALGAIPTSHANGETNPPVPYAFQGTVKLNKPFTTTVTVVSNSVTQNANNVSFSGTVRQGNLAKPQEASPNGVPTTAAVTSSRISNKQILQQVLGTNSISGFTLVYDRPDVLDNGVPAAPIVFAYKSKNPAQLIEIDPSIFDLGIAWTDDGGQLGIEAGVFSGTASLTVNPATLEVATNNPSRNKFSVFTPFTVAFKPSVGSPRFEDGPSTSAAKGIGTLTENRTGISTATANISGYTYGQASLIPK
jgi:hypothetical protein